MKSALGHQLGAPLRRVPQLAASPQKWTSPRVLKLKKIMPDSLKPSSQKGAQVSLGAGGVPMSPIHAAPDHDPAGASSMLGPTESPRASPPSPYSHGLEATGGSQRGEGSSVPQLEEVPWQRSWVAESLWDNLDFIQVGFHVSWFVTAAIDTKVVWENIMALYSTLKTTSDQIDVSALTIHLIALPCHGFDSFLT
jgi:hypothetical protein